MITEVVLSYSAAQIGQLLLGGMRCRAASQPISAAPLVASHAEVVEAKPFAYPPSRSTPSGAPPAALCALRAADTTCGAQLLTEWACRTWAWGQVSGEAAWVQVVGYKGTHQLYRSALGESFEVDSAARTCCTFSPPRSGGGEPSGST